LPVREGEQELLVEVFGKQKGSLLGAGRAKAVQLPALGIESFAGKRTKILEAAFGIAALDTSDAFYVVAAAFKPFRHMGDTFQAELAVVLGVEGVVGIGESGEMVVEDKAQDICPPRNIGGGLCGSDRERR
jgi:hypothetical protein